MSLESDRILRDKMKADKKEAKRARREAERNPKREQQIELARRAAVLATSKPQAPVVRPVRVSRIAQRRLEKQGK